MRMYLLMVLGLLAAQTLMAGTLTLTGNVLIKDESGTPAVAFED